ncbi:MAG: hypothetical protein ACI805_002881 [Candidatus Azotimanducaceae bacterium]
MDNLVEKIGLLHQALKLAKLPHAFGGALALAWCTERARGTIDIDINILIPDADYQLGVEALPADVKVTKKDLQLLKRDGQARVWWHKTPVDLFFNSTDFHSQLLDRIRWESFAGQRIPFLSCYDLAVFKAFFNRTKDWADLEEMYAVGTLNIEQVQATLIHYLGADDERILQLGKLRELT